MEQVPHEAAVRETHEKAHGFSPISSDGYGNGPIVGWAFMVPSPEVLLREDWFWMTADGAYVTCDKSDSYSQASSRCRTFLRYRAQPGVSLTHEKEDQT